MTKHVMPRGLIGSVRADASDPAKVLAGLKESVDKLQADSKTQIDDLLKVFADFKAENDKRIEDLKTGKADVVTDEKVEKINAALGEQQKIISQTGTAIETLNKEIDALNAKTAALTVGPAGGDPKLSPEVRAHAEAFNKFARKGIDTGLKELEIKASLSRESDPDGGYVVTQEMENTLDRVVTTMVALRSLATVRRMSGSVYKKPFVVSGAASGWVGETAARSETGTPTMSELSFAAMEVYANPGITQNLLDDASFDIGAWLADEVGIEFSEQEGRAFIQGGGVTEPRGILSYDMIANASWTWGKVGFVVTGASADFPATAPADRILDLIYALKRQYRQNAAFLMGDVIQAKIRKFKDGEGNYLWQPSVQMGEPARLFGYRVDTDDFMPDVGSNAFPVAFGDFRRGYLIADRIGVRVLRDPYSNKPYVMFYTTRRVAAGIQNFEAIKLLKCSV